MLKLTEVVKWRLHEQVLVGRPGQIEDFIFPPWPLHKSISRPSKSAFENPISQANSKMKFTVVDCSDFGRIMAGTRLFPEDFTSKLFD